jgi:competence protein ComEC
MKARPFVVFVCFWLLGVSIPSMTHGPSQWAALGGGMLLLAGFGIAGKLTWRTAAVCALAMSLAFVHRTAAERGDVSGISGRWEGLEPPAAGVVQGFIATPPERDGDRVQFQLAVGEIRDHIGSDQTYALRETVLVRIRLKDKQEIETASSWHRGDGVEAAGSPERPEEAGNFGAFDYRRYLERQGMTWVWAVHGAEGIRITEAAVPLRYRLLRAVDQFRSAVGDLMDRLYPDGDAGYMKGLVAGIAEDVDPDQYDAFARLGLTHVLAISGLHVAVVVFVLLRLGALCRLTRERSIDIAFAAMPVYMLVTGASPSAVRACLMAMIALALARRHLLKDGLHLLAAAALLMVLWNPAAILDVSFQLSFAVTAGLLLFTRTAAGLLESIPWKPLRNALAVGLTAQAASFPLTIYYFHGFHLLSLPANLLLVPFISFAVMPLGMASVVLGAMWLPLGLFPAVLASWGNRLTFALTSLLDQELRLRTVWPQPSLLWVAASYGLLGIFVWFIRRRQSDQADQRDTDHPEETETVPLPQPGTVRRRFSIRRAAAAAALLICAGGWLVWGYRPAFLDRQASIQFLDVGQGDAMLIRTGTGKHVLVDAGGTVRFRKPGEEWRDRKDPYEVGRKLLVPLLRQRGIRQLRAIVLTHLDADHMGGAEAVIRDIPVGALIWNGTWKENRETERLFAAAQEKGIPIYAAESGAKWELDDSASIEILHPNPESPSGKPGVLPEMVKQNHSSVVTLLTLYGRRFLLTGDIELPDENEILRTVGTRHMAIDVAKAAHHGSKTSTGEAWLKEWRPLEVVISAGRNNVYGHPHPSVVQRLQANGISFRRTDANGEIQYRVTPQGRLLRRQKFGES